MMSLENWSGVKSRGQMSKGVPSNAPPKIDPPVHLTHSGDHATHFFTSGLGRITPPEQSGNTSETDLDGRVDMSLSLSLSPGKAIVQILLDTKIEPINLCRASRTL